MVRLISMPILNVYVTKELKAAAEAAAAASDTTPTLLAASILRVALMEGDGALVALATAPPAPKLTMEERLLAALRAEFRPLQAIASEAEVSRRDAFAVLMYLARSNPKRCRGPEATAGGAPGFAALEVSP